LTRRSLSSSSGHEVVCGISGQRIARLALAIDDELRQLAP
jgi:hypothetical protein